MKVFIGRKTELAALEKEYTRDNGFVVIYGRRRVGKTTLIKKFISDKPALYFLATEELQTGSINRFAEVLSRFTNQPYLASANFQDWEALFKIFAAYKPEEKKILVIDEFQYLINANSAFASIFQRIWDEVLSQSNVMVILCGSLISMMTTHVLSYSSPLYGRRTAQIRLKPLTFTEMSEEVAKASFTDLVELYSVTGGVPKYYEFFNNNNTLYENIQDVILSNEGFLYEEPIFLLEKEVKETISYFSIIKTIALGNHKLSAISSVLNMPSNALNPYLKTLMDLDIIEKNVPATEAFPEKSRKGLYFIKDNFINFWFKFAAPYKGELEIGNTVFVMNKLKNNFVDNHVSFIFEKICRELVLALSVKGELKSHFNRIGAYWDNNIEIDICALNYENKYALLGECKYLERPVDADVLFDLMKKSDKIPELKEYKKEYAVFSKSSFTERLMEVASNNSSVYLINKGRIINK